MNDLTPNPFILKILIFFLTLGSAPPALSDKISYTAKGRGYYRVLDESGKEIEGGNITEREALEKAAQLSMDNQKIYFVVHDYKVEVLFTRSQAPDQTEDAGSSLTKNLVFEWAPPTKRMDGSPLPPDQIKEYLVYGGETKASLKPVAAFSNKEGLLSQAFAMPSKLRFFAISAADQDGRESDLSNIVEIQI